MAHVVLYGSFTMWKNDHKINFIKLVIKKLLLDKTNRLSVIDVSSESRQKDYPKSDRLYFEKGFTWLRDHKNLFGESSLQDLCNFSLFCTRNLVPLIEACWLEKRALSISIHSIYNTFVGIYKMYQHYGVLLNTKEDTKVLIFGAYMPNVRVFRLLAFKTKAEITYMEYGMLPGFVFKDDIGLNADSWVVRRCKDFNRLKITKTDLKNATNYINSVRKLEMNMKPQKKKLPLNIKSSKHTVFVVGMELMGSGIVPRIAKSSKQLSPLYADNIEILRQISRSNQSNLVIVYTSHPNMRNYPSFGDNEEDVSKSMSTFLKGYDAINLIKTADVIVTIGSSVSYLALIHNKPCVLVGKNGLYGKGCTYEVKHKNQLIPQIDKAINKGVTDLQQQNFVKYVARELKYNLYSLPQMPFGKYTNKDTNKFIKDVFCSS